MNMNDFWRERLQSYIQELRRYFKYMFNDHLLFVLIFGGGAAIYYYSNWVKTLSSDFPVEIVMAFIIGVVLAISPVTTLLKEADIVFLLPLETKLGSYFKKGINVSLFTQAYIVLLILAILMPMYVSVTGRGFRDFFYLLIIAFGLKIWNLIIHWLMLKLHEQHVLVFDWVIRFIFNALLFYFIVEQASFSFIAITLIIMIVFTIYSFHVGKGKTIYWELLIDKEQRRMQMFYHAANMFTDVPHLRGRVKRRRWLDPLLRIIPYGTEHTYRFLYSRTLVRTSEFSGLIVRLSIIAILLLLFINNVYVSLAVSILFIYLTGFQLLPLLRQHDLKIWTSLYPIHANEKKIAFLQLLWKVLLSQAVLFAVSSAASGNVIQGLIVGGVSIVFALFFSKLYAPSRIRKFESLYE